MICLSCGANVFAGMRFCGACGAPVDESTRVASRDDARTRFAGNDDPTHLARGEQDANRSAPDSLDSEATRLARDTRDTEATRVTFRSPFDEPRGAPARVERLPSENDPPALRAREAQTAPSARQTPPPARQHAEDEDAERVIFSIRPTMLYVSLGYVLAAAAAVGLTVLLAIFNLLPALYSVLVSLPLLLIPAYHHLKRNTVRYTLTDAKIEIDRGLIARRTRNIPLRTIQDVTVSATIPQRLLGYGDLIIENASEVGGTTVMRNIPSPRRHADLLLRELRRWN